MDADDISTSSFGSLDLEVSEEFEQSGSATSARSTFEVDEEDLDLCADLFQRVEKDQFNDSSSKNLASTSFDVEGTHFPTSSTFSCDDPDIASKITGRKSSLFPDDPGSLKEIYSETIKEEIRCKIQLRRISMGQEELKVDFTEPEPTICFDAVRSRNEIREKNKMYAKQSRDRARALRNELIESNRRLTAQRLKLKKDITNLRRVLNIYQDYVNQHITVCRYLDP